MAVGATYRALRERPDNPCVVLPTGSGKSHVIAQICRDAASKGRRVLVVAHVKELLEQTAAKLRDAYPEVSCGLYSASLGRKELNTQVVIAGIQSIYRARNLPDFSVVIVDEAHCIPLSGEGMYRTLIAGLQEKRPDLRIIGMTATPYRLRGGLICGPDNVLNHICCDVDVADLIAQGYLSKLVTKGSRHDLDTSGLHVRAGEFISDEVNKLVNTSTIVSMAVDEIIERTHDRLATLIFCANIEHAKNVAATLRAKSCSRVVEVYGHTHDDDRDRAVAEFRAGELKYLVNVNVYTTGFDAPNIDCIVMLRPTASPGLFYQQVGRGLRIHPGKENCLVLDFAGNVMRHGPIDDIAVRSKPNANKSSGNSPMPIKKCPDCTALIPLGSLECPHCGHVFTPPEPKHEGTPSDAEILSGSVKTHHVLDVTYQVHVKQGVAPKTMRVDYFIGPNEKISEWICFEHTGYPREKAERWWSNHGGPLPVPLSAQGAVDIARATLARPKTIRVKTRPDEKFSRVIRVMFEPVKTSA